MYDLYDATGGTSFCRNLEQKYPKLIVCGNHFVRWLPLGPKNGQNTCINLTATLNGEINFRVRYCVSIF